MKSCCMCGSKKHLVDYGFRPDNQTFICESCEEDNAYELENAVLSRCPGHFKEVLGDAFDSFCVSDRETDFIDVLWNLGDCIYDPKHEMSHLFEDASILPTPEEFRDMMEDFGKALNPKSPRYDPNPDPLDWNFVRKNFGLAEIWFTPDGEKVEYIDGVKQ